MATIEFEGPITAADEALWTIFPRPNHPTTLRSLGRIHHLSRHLHPEARHMDRGEHPLSPRLLGLSEDRPEPHSNHQSSGTHQPETQTAYPRVRVFPYDWSLLRLVSALLAEIIEERGIGKLHLKMASMNPPAN